MMKNHARAETVLSKAMMRVIELEATLAVLKAPSKKNYRDVQSQMVDRATSYALEV